MSDSLLSNELIFAYSEIGSITASLNISDPPSAQYKFTWNSTEYDAIAAIEILGEIFGAGGFTEDNNLTLTVQLSVFGGGATPTPHQFITYKGNQYRITQIKPSPDGTGIVIGCNDPDRGTGIVPREM